MQLATQDEWRSVFLCLCGAAGTQTQDAGPVAPLGGSPCDATTLESPHA